MSDEQFRNVCQWIADQIGAGLNGIESGFSEMGRTQWFIALIITCVIGFLCMKSLRADQRM